MWSVRCRLCRLHESTLTSKCGGTQAINNRQPRKGWAWKGSGGDHYKQFQNLKKVLEQTWLFDFWNAFHSWTQTKTEQTEWLSARSYFISLLKIFYRFYCLSFSFIIHAVIFLYCFYVNILEFLVSTSSAFSQLYRSTCKFFTSQLEKDRRTVETSSIFIVKAGPKTCYFFPK